MGGKTLRDWLRGNMEPSVGYYPNCYILSQGWLVWIFCTPKHVDRVIQSW
jgi:hypothetical protein